MRPNWELRNCCHHEQVVFLITISVCTVVILALWRTVLLKPFKLVTVFLHEASHAIACKLTCGHVEGIQVHVDEGGSTQTRGGIYWFILPAGYLGSSFWGMLFILASTNLLTARIAAGLDTSRALYRIYCIPWRGLASPRNNKSARSSLRHYVHWCNEQLVFCL
ncbi:hypothetical protein EUGRSUZ_B00733 [Eucalyptus grandis]|uniref:Uncharacterized protein n=2 Tax=Eucalyptus grandis TaxID=71139 RepID=A0A059D0Z1_EUCGR|nr:hypothetical protein EUGRSUZ_B00733 [Eucalyptus grandis]